MRHSSVMSASLVGTLTNAPQRDGVDHMIQANEFMGLALLQRTVAFLGT